MAFNLCSVTKTSIFYYKNTYVITVPKYSRIRPCSFDPYLLARYRYQMYFLDLYLQLKKSIIPIFLHPSEKLITLLPNSAPSEISPDRRRHHAATTTATVLEKTFNFYN